MRLDLFLKTSRIIKRRSVAREACEKGSVLVNGLVAKPSKEVKQGDRIIVKFSSRILELEILEEQQAASRTLQPKEPYRVMSETRVQKNREQ